MANRNGKSSGEGIIKLANVLQVVLSILCVLGGGFLIAAGCLINNGSYNPGQNDFLQDGTTMIVMGVLFIIVGLICTAIYAKFIRCFGEMAVDLHCMRNSNATLAEFVDTTTSARRNREQQ